MCVPLLMLISNVKSGPRHDIFVKQHHKYLFSVSVSIEVIDGYKNIHIPDLNSVFL